MRRVAPGEVRLGGHVGRVWTGGRRRRWWRRSQSVPVGCVCPFSVSRTGAAVSIECGGNRGRSDAVVAERIPTFVKLANRVSSYCGGDITSLAMPSDSGGLVSTVEAAVPADLCSLARRPKVGVTSALQLSNSADPITPRPLRAVQTQIDTFRRRTRCYAHRGACSAVADGWLMARNSLAAG